MSLEISNFKSSDNLNLSFQSYGLHSGIHKIVLVVHGHGEHAGRFGRVAERLTQAGLGVAVLSVRGHGDSEGRRGHAPSMEQLLLDVEYFIRQIRIDYLDAELILYGHSMGGNIILNYLIKDQSEEIKAGIATSPWLRLAFEPPKWKVSLGNFIADLIPIFTQASGLATDEISSLKEEVVRYEQDPLIHNKISAKLFKVISLGGDNIFFKNHKINHPVFLAHGTLDKITSFPATKSLAQDHPSFTFKAYVNSKHEIHHDVDCESLLTDIIEWIEQL